MIKKSIKYEIVASREGHPTISISHEGKNFFLHSKFYPTKEAGNFEKIFISDKFDLIIVLGTGLGYHLLPIKENLRKFKKIILIDIIDIKNEITKNKITSFLTKSEKIIFITGEDEDYIINRLWELINLDKIKGINVVEHAPSMKVFSDYYGNVKKAIEKLINKKAGSRAAKKTFGSLYFKNIIKNFYNSDKLKSVDNLFGFFKDYPSIIITSGPTLVNNLDTIIEHQDKFFIIAVDSALPVLIKSNIIPDFFISIDPQPYIYEHFFDLNLGRSVPVFSASAYNGILKKFQCFISLNSHPLCQLIDELFPNEIGSIDSATGTVAGDAVCFSDKLGFKSTGLVGFDFSFSHYKIYSNGSAYQNRYSLYFQDRFSTVETFNVNYMFKSSKGFKYSGKFTRKSFIQYKESVESFLMESGMGNIYNINKGCIDITGAPYINIQDYIKNFCQIDIPKADIVYGIVNNSESINSEIIKNGMNDVLKNPDFFQKVMEASFEKSPGTRMTEKFMKLLGIRKNIF